MLSLSPKIIKKSVLDWLCLYDVVVSQLSGRDKSTGVLYSHFPSTWHGLGKVSRAVLSFIDQVYSGQYAAVSISCTDLTVPEKYCQD